MARAPRLDVPGYPVHVVQRGNNRQVCFKSNSDYSFYLYALQRACLDRQCQLHAFVLMTNHTHLLVTPAEKGSVSLMMMDLGRRYVRYFNDTHDRSGTLWEGRFKSSLVDTGRYCLACYRYIELNPVRAGMVSLPGQYHWSSFRANALGLQSRLITPHSEWIGLGSSDRMRRKAYLALFDEDPAEDEVKAIQRALRKGMPLGNSAFRHQVEANLGINLSSGRRGRPGKKGGQVQ